MSAVNHIDLLQRAIRNQAIEAGIKTIDQIKDWDKMQEAVSFLHSVNSPKEDAACASFLLGDIMARYEKWAEAYVCFVKSAELGINSGRYKAGIILTDHESAVGASASISAADLFSIASANGHIWARLIVLRSRSKSSAFGKINMWLNRILLLQLKLLLSLIFKGYRDNMRY